MALQKQGVCRALGIDAFNHRQCKAPRAPFPGSLEASRKRRQRKCDTISMTTTASPSRLRGPTIRPLKICTNLHPRPASSEAIADWRARQDISAETLTNRTKP